MKAQECAYLHNANSIIILILWKGFLTVIIDITIEKLFHL